MDSHGSVPLDYLITIHHDPCLTRLERGSYCLEFFILVAIHADWAVIDCPNAPERLYC